MLGASTFHDPSPISTLHIITICIITYTYVVHLLLILYAHSYNFNLLYFIQANGYLVYDPSDQITSVISSIHSTLPSTPKRLPLVAPPTQVEQTSIDNFASLVVWEILLFGISLPSNATVSSSPTPSTYLRGTHYETRMSVPQQSRTTFVRQQTSSQTLVFQIRVIAQQIIHITTTSFYISLKLY